MTRRLAPFAAFAAAAVAAATLSACATTPRANAAGGAVLRLGYFANVTHATALVGVERGTFAARLGPTALETEVFNAGPAAVEALFAGSVDAAYIGPSPTINAYVRSKGSALRIVAGATSGGASLVVRPGITSAEQLRGQAVATPQLGNTQDVALRAWLGSHGLRTDLRGSGDVDIVPTDNATTLELFSRGDVAGAWLPEPWASRLVLDGGARVLVDERDLWPGGRFVTTHLVVATKFLVAHPDVVRRLVEAHVETTDWLTEHEGAAKAVLNGALRKLTQQALPDALLDRAFAELTFTTDPVAASLRTSAEHAAAAGLLDDPDLAGIYDLRILDEVLARAGVAPVSDGGLGAR